MSVASTLASLKSELQELEGIYGLRFANHSRLTRNVKALDALITRGRSLREQLMLQSDSEARDLQRRISEMLSQYEDEREIIAKVQSEGPELIEARILGQRANIVIYRYRRHFAGFARNTRDLALLAEMIEDLQGTQREMLNLRNAYGEIRGLDDDLEVVRNQIELFNREGDAIAQAQSEGTIEERAGLLGTLANAQFENYRIFFAGQSRLSRRPQLMERIIGSLEYLIGEMEMSGKRGLRADFNKRNQEIVQERLDAYRTELAAIREARENASLDEVLDALAQAANQLLSDYGKHFAGQSRTNRDLVLLSELCDRIGETERQMTAMSRVTEAPNIDIARDALAMFEREHREITQVQKKG